jgi:hypothetical protein
MKQPSAAVRLTAIALASVLTAGIAWTTTDVLPALNRQASLAQLPHVTLERVVVRPASGQMAADARSQGAN